MLDFIYYPVSFILWCWHKVFGFIFGDASALAWILGIMFLTFTVRGIMFKPFVKQVRSMRKMQEFAPEMKRVQKKYANDKQRQAAEMQKLQREHGVNPLGSCLPMLLQIPVFIGLNWVLRNFAPGKSENYFFDAAGNASYVDAKLFGVNLGDAIHHISTLGGSVAANAGGWNWHVAPVAIPLMIVASVATHFTAKHSVQRQNPATATAQTAMMNKLTQYVFPLGVLVFGSFFPIGLLVYWISNNGWTLMQQKLVYSWIDKEEEAKKAEAIEKKSAMAPKPGQKPKQAQKPKSGQKAVEQKTPGEGTDSSDTSGSESEQTAGNSKQANTGSSSKSNAAGKSKRPGSPHRFAEGGNQGSRPAGAQKKSSGNGNSNQKKPTNSGAKDPGVATNSSKKTGRKRS